MPFLAKDFYDLALWLVQQRTDEVSLRTAISRVYYAGHLLAVQRLMQKGWEPRGGGEDQGSTVSGQFSRTVALVRTDCLGQRVVTRQAEVR